MDLGDTVRGGKGGGGEDVLVHNKLYSLHNFIQHIAG